MSIDELRKAVYERFLAQWGSATVVTLEGEDFTEPGPEVTWVRVSVKELAGGQLTLGDVGNRKFERDFVAIIQIFSLATGGMQTGSSHAHTIRGIFEGVRLDPEAWFNDGTATDIPLRTGAKSRQTNVEVFGKYQETK